MPDNALIKKMNCPVCKASKVEYVKIGRQPVLLCTNCGLHFTDSLPNEENHEKYYKNEYRLSENESLGNEKRRVARIAEQIQLVSDIKKLVPPPGLIIDIGCDKGYFLDEARRYGYSVMGIEISSESINYLDRIGIKTYRSIHDICDKPDVVTMWHSLEHHIDPLKSLTDINKLMKDKGYLFIRVPAFDSLCRKLMSDKWVWFQPENHYYHFSYKSLAYLIKSSGFEILSINKRWPNNRLTSRMFHFSNQAFKVSFNSSISLRKKLGNIYQSITGVELYAVARKTK